MPSSYALAAPVFPTVKMNPESCLAMLKIDSVLGDGSIQRSSNAAAEDDTTKILPFEKWLVEEQEYVEPWNAVSRGLTILIREFTLLERYKAIDHDDLKLIESQSGKDKSAQAFLSQHTHFEFTYQNRCQNLGDCHQLEANKFDDESLDSDRQQEIQLGIKFTIPTSRDFEILDLDRIEFRRSVPRGSQQPSQNKAGGKSNLSIQCASSPGCRKRFIEPSGDDEEPFEPSNGGGGPNRSNIGPSTRRKCQKYACPFYLTDPENSVYQSGEEHEKCRTEGVEASKLKEHIRRKHTKPEQCPTCGFRGERGILRKHQQKVPCTTPEGGFEKVDADTVEKDKLLKPKNQSWSQVFKILFPGRPVPKSEFIPPTKLRTSSSQLKGSNTANDQYWLNFKHWLVLNFPDVCRMFQQSPEYIRFAAQHADINPMKDVFDHSQAVEKLLSAGMTGPLEEGMGMPGTSQQNDLYQTSTIGVDITEFAAISRTNDSDYIQRRTIVPDQSLLVSPPPEIPVQIDPGQELSRSIPTPELSDNPSNSRCASLSDFLEADAMRQLPPDSPGEGSSTFFEDALNFHGREASEIRPTAREQNFITGDHQNQWGDPNAWNNWLPLTEKPRPPILD